MHQDHIHGHSLSRGGGVQKAYIRIQRLPMHRNKELVAESAAGAWYEIQTVGSRGRSTKLRVFGAQVGANSRTGMKLNLTER
jgi:hypothetical protein